MASTAAAPSWVRKQKPSGKNPTLRQIRMSRSTSRCGSRSTIGAGRVCRSICGPANICRSGTLRSPSASSRPLRGAFQDTPVDTLRPNWLVLRIAPDEGISLQFEVKRRFPVMDLAAVNMDFHYHDWFTKEKHAKPVLRPARKLAILSALTDEMRNTSVPAAESIVGQALAIATERALDGALFSANAATAVAPAGLLFGLTPLASAGGSGVDGLADDFALLAGALGQVTNADEAVRFCATNSAPTTSPTSVCGKAWTISMRSAGRFKPSPAVSRATRHSGSMSTSTSRCYSALPSPSPSARSDIRESKSMTCA